MQLDQGPLNNEFAPQAIPPESSALFVSSVALSGLLLTPVALAAAVLGAWRLGADLGWTSGFFITGGVLSRYQSWIAIAIGAQTSAVILNRWSAHHDKQLMHLIE